MCLIEAEERCNLELTVGIEDKGVKYHIDMLALSNLCGVRAVNDDKR